VSFLDLASVPPLFLFLLIPILLGLFFHRKFISIWYLVSVNVSIMLISIIALFSGGNASVFEFFSLIAGGLLLSSIFAVLAFLSSTKGNNYSNIQNLQETLNRLPNKFKIATLVQVHVLFIFLISLFFLPPPIIIIGSIALFAGFAGIFHWMYRKAKSLPEKALIFEKSDYLYFYIPLLILMGFFILLLTML